MLWMSSLWFTTLEYISMKTSMVKLATAMQSPPSSKFISTPLGCSVDLTGQSTSLPFKRKSWRISFTAISPLELAWRQQSKWCFLRKVSGAALIAKRFPASWFTLSLKTLHIKITEVINTQTQTFPIFQPFIQLCSKQHATTYLCILTGGSKEVHFI